jgi:hypothetical protein
MSFATRHGNRAPFPGAGNPASKYSMLEFGVANGNGFQLMLHFRDFWLRKLRLQNKVLCVGFDTFEGIPPPSHQADAGVPVLAGDFNEVSLDGLRSHLLRHGFNDFEFVKGPFKETLKTQSEFLREYPPIFVSLDCDYYSSTMDVLEHLLPTVVPHGCLFYFDDASFWSEKGGQMRAVAEVNAGKFGSHFQLCEFPLWIETKQIVHYKQVWRLLNTETDRMITLDREEGEHRQVGRDKRISPL